MGTLSLLSVGMSGQSHVLCYSLKVINMCFQAWIMMVWPRDHSHSAVTSGFFFCVSWWSCCNTHACRHGGQRWTLGIFSNHSLFHWLTEAVSLTLRLIHLGWLTRKPQASAVPLHQLWGYRCVPLCLVFTWMIGIWTQVFMLAWQICHPLSLCPSSFI